MHSLNTFLVLLISSPPQLYEMRVLFLIFILQTWNWGTKRLCKLAAWVSGRAGTESSRLVSEPEFLPSCLWVPFPSSHRRGSQVDTLMEPPPFPFSSLASAWRSMASLRSEASSVSFYFPRWHNNARMEVGAAGTQRAISDRLSRKAKQNVGF